MIRLRFYLYNHALRSWNRAVNKHPEGAVSRLHYDMGRWTYDVRLA